MIIRKSFSNTNRFTEYCNLDKKYLTISFGRTQRDGSENAFFLQNNQCMIDYTCPYMSDKFKVIVSLIANPIPDKCCSEI